MAIDMGRLKNIETIILPIIWERWMRNFERIHDRFLKDPASISWIATQHWSNWTSLYPDGPGRAERFHLSNDGRRAIQKELVRKILPVRDRSDFNDALSTLNRLHQESGEQQRRSMAPIIDFFLQLVAMERFLVELMIIHKKVYKLGWVQSDMIERETRCLLTAHGPIHYWKRWYEFLHRSRIRIVVRIQTILAQGEWWSAKEAKAILKRCNKRQRQTFCNMENVDPHYKSSWRRISQTICIPSQNTEDLTMKQIFDISEKLISEQSDEIYGVKTFGWEDSSSKYSLDRRQTCSEERIEVLSNTIECSHSSQHIASRKLYGWKLEKSYTQKCMRHLGLLQRSQWNTNGQKNWVRKLINNQTTRRRSCSTRNILPTNPTNSNIRATWWDARWKKNVPFPRDQCESF